MQTLFALNSISPYKFASKNSLRDALDELKLRAVAQDNLAAMLEIGPGATYLLLEDSRQISYLSSKANDIFPKSFFDLLESSSQIEELIHPEDLDTYQRTLSLAVTSNNEAKLEYRIATSPNKTWLPVQDFRIALKDDAQKVVAYVGKLIANTALMQTTQSHVQESWKEVSNSAVRRFLHDFNNTVAGIYSLSELYAQEGASMQSMTEGMAHIRDSSMRAQKATQHIRDVTMMTCGQKTYIELDKIIEDKKELILSLLPKGTELKLELSGKSMPLYIDFNHFTQILMHLAANSGQAVGKKPIFTVRSSPSSIDKNGKSIAAICIEIIDNGKGMMPLNTKKATQAFFTNKDPEKHKGMGLYAVQNFVDDYDGSLEIESEENTGTKIRITLPSADLNETLSNSEEEDVPSEINEKQKKQNERPLTLLIYSWEDIAHSPLLSMMREKGWRYRIHIDPYQVKLDARDLKDSLDGVVVFYSGLDDNAIPLLQELQQSELKNKTAVINMDGPQETLPPTAQDDQRFESSSDVKPATQLKRLAKYFN